MGISLPNNRPCRSARSSSPPSTTRCFASGRSRSRCSVSSTRAHCWHRPSRCRCAPMAASSRSDCPSPSSNTACGRTTARAARRPVAIVAILAESRNASAAAGSRKYYASVMNLKEFYEDNIGREFCGILSDFAQKCNKRY